jgi:hypothetical protein
MEIKYNLRPSDSVELGLHYLSRIRFLRHMFLAPIVLLPAGCIFFFIAYRWPDAPESELHFFYGGISLAMALYCWKPFHRLAGTIKAALLFDPKLAQNQRLTIGRDSLVLKGDVGESVFRWSAIEQVAATASHAFIYLSKRAAIIVPARAFTGVEEFQSFVSQARAYHETALASARSDHNAAVEGGG